MSSISPISSATAMPAIAPIDTSQIGSGSGAAQSASGTSFGNSLSGAVDGLHQTQSNSDNLALQAATGKLTDIQDYMIAANQAEVSTQLTVAVRNKAVDAFNQIMNMQV